MLVIYPQLKYIIQSYNNPPIYSITSFLPFISAVSQLYANNVPLDLISNLVGHSGIATTKQVYLHQTEEKIQAISNLWTN